MSWGEVGWLVLAIGTAALLAAGSFFIPGRPATEGVWDGAEGRCRECGCTDARACPGGCSWVEADLCSACEGPA